MKATCTKTWENTRFLKRFGKQHEHNMKATCTKTWEHDVLETFWKATWTQHESNMHKMGKQQVLETFWKATWTQHESNVHKKPGKTPGS